MSWGSEEQVKDVVQNRRMLSWCANEDIRGIYLRQSKSVETIANERNQDLLLKLMGQYEQFRRKPDGTLVPKMFQPPGGVSYERRRNSEHNQWMQSTRGLPYDRNRSYSFDTYQNMSNDRNGAHYQQH